MTWKQFTDTHRIVVVVVYFHKLRSYSITTLYICMEPEINASGMLLSLGFYNKIFDAYKANMCIFTSSAPVVLLLSWSVDWTWVQLCSVSPGMERTHCRTALLLAQQVQLAGELSRWAMESSSWQPFRGHCLSVYMLPKSVWMPLRVLVLKASMREDCSLVMVSK